jgi:hypothetical protein
VSAIQVMSAASMGVGAAEPPSKVRWLVLCDPAAASLVTIPATATVSALVLLVLHVLRVQPQATTISHDILAGRHDVRGKTGRPSANPDCEVTE